jgi:hypothetical protein
MSNSSTYQNKVNNLVGAMGPSGTATWNNTGSTTGAPWLLSAQPMYYSPVTGKYITSYDSLASSQGSASFSYGKSRKSRKTKRKSKKSRKTKRKSRKHKNN